MGAFDIELLLQGLYPTGDQAGRPPAGAAAQPAEAAQPTRRAVPQHPAVWRVGERPTVPVRAIPCGIPELERQLPGGGWQPACINEVIGNGTGIGEVSVLLPALAHLSRRGETVAWIAAPFIPYAPALQQAGVDLKQTLRIEARNEADALWAAEQSLRSGTCGAVLVWLTGADHTALRRLQLAAEAGNALCFVLRDRSHAGATSPAAVRVAVDSDGRRRQVRLLKCRGGQSGHVSLAA
jgi:hypothetical protein